MIKIATMVTAPANATLGFAERLMVGITNENGRRLVRHGDQPVDSNHPVWILGHLCIYPAKVLEMAKQQPASATQVPADWEQLFGPGSVCRDDPDGKLYPTLETLRTRYIEGYRAAIAAVAATEDAVFQEENPSEGRLKELFPSRGAMLSFYLSVHPMMHLGQWSTWRRMIGLSPA